MYLHMPSPNASVVIFIKLEIQYEFHMTDIRFYIPRISGLQVSIKYR
jgi:hypothetical protein